jgi:hypothetical protein
VTGLEEELAMNRKERDRLLKEQHDYYAREIEKLKADHLQMMTLANERNQAQQQEIHNLQVSKLSSLHLALPSYIYDHYLCRH